MNTKVGEMNGFTLVASSVHAEAPSTVWYDGKIQN